MMIINDHVMTSGRFDEREREREGESARQTRKRKYTYTHFDKCNKIKYQDIMARDYENHTMATNNSSSTRKK